MAEAHQARVTKAVEDMVQSLERDQIRKMQVTLRLLAPRRTMGSSLHGLSPERQAVILSCLEHAELRCTQVMKSNVNK